MPLRRSTPTSAKGPGPGPSRRYVVFGLDGCEYGIDARQVRHSLLAREVPGAHVSFLARAYPLVDLRRLLGLPSSTEAGGLVVVVEGAAAGAGLVVDGPVGLLLVDPEAIFPLPPLFRGVERQWLEGVARLDRRLVVLIRVEGILSARYPSEHSSSPMAAPAAS